MADEETNPGFIPRRLSTGEDVRDYEPRNFIATGKSIMADSGADTNSTDQIDPRAPAEQPLRTAIHRSIDGSDDLLAKLFTQAIWILNHPSDELSINEELILKSADAALSQLSDEIAGHLKQPAKSSSRKRSTRKATTK